MSVPLYAALSAAKHALAEGRPPNIENDVWDYMVLMAQYIVEHLGPLLECGYESPVVNHNYIDARIDIPEYIGVPVEDAQTIASAILRACDEAKEE